MKAINKLLNDMTRTHGNVGVWTNKTYDICHYKCFNATGDSLSFEGIQRYFRLMKRAIDQVMLGTLTAEQPSKIASVSMLSGGISVEDVAFSSTSKPGAEK